MTIWYKYNSGQICIVLSLKKKTIFQSIIISDQSSAGSVQDQTGSTEHGACDWWRAWHFTCHCTQTSQRSVLASWPVRVSQGRAPAVLSGGSKRKMSGMCRTIVLAPGTSYPASFQDFGQCRPRGRWKKKREFPRKRIYSMEYTPPHTPLPPQTGLIINETRNYKSFLPPKR